MDGPYLTFSLFLQYPSGAPLKTLTIKRIDQMMSVFSLRKKNSQMHLNIHPVTQ